MSNYQKVSQSGQTSFGGQQVPNDISRSASARAILSFDIQLNPNHKVLSGSICIYAYIYIIYIYIVTMTITIYIYIHVYENE